MKALKFLLAICVVTIMAVSVAQAAATAKVLVQDSGATLRFVCDESTPAGMKNADWFLVSEAEKLRPFDNPLWNAMRTTVTKVVFDSSFADYCPKHCGSWFFGFEALVEVEGLENLNTSQATSLVWMFGHCTSLTSLDLSGLDTANVENMGSLFSGCSALTSLNVSGFNTAKVTNMSYMFNSCLMLPSLDLADFDTAKVTNMSQMFAKCASLETIAVSGAFVTTEVADAYDMFSGCFVLVGGAGTPYDSEKVDATYAQVDGKDGLPGYFAGMYTIHFVAGDGADGVMPDQICAQGRVYNLDPCSFKAPSGKTFEGWVCKDAHKLYDDGVLIFDLAAPGETVTLTAAWK